jgi:hypothetical protein
MRRQKTILFVAGATALLLASIAIVIPVTGHAGGPSGTEMPANGARYPFLASCTASIVALGDLGCSISLPAGKEYVIQSISAFVLWTPSPAAATFELDLTSGGATGPAIDAAPLQHVFQGPVNDIWSFNAVSTNLYADGGTPIRPAVTSPAPNAPNPKVLTVHLTGYYVNTP